MNIFNCWNLGNMKIKNVIRLFSLLLILYACHNNSTTELENKRALLQDKISKLKAEYLYTSLSSSNPNSIITNFQYLDSLDHAADDMNLKAINFYLNFIELALSENGRPESILCLECNRQVPDNNGTYSFGISGVFCSKTCMREWKSRKK